MATTSAPAIRAVPQAPGRWSLLARQLDYWLTVQRRTWRGAVVAAFFTPLLYLGALGVMLGRYVDQVGAPGLLAGQAMLLTVGDATYPVFGRMTWDKTYVGMLATPLSVADVITAHLLAIVARVGLSCAVFMCGFAPFGLYASVAGAVGAWLVQVLIACAFAGPVFAYTAGLRSDSSFAVLHRVVQVPMYLFSGAFFPITALPEAIRWIAQALPLWHGVEVTRMVMLGHVDVAAAVGHVAYLALLGGLGAWLAVRRMRRRLLT